MFPTSELAPCPNPQDCDFGSQGICPLIEDNVQSSRMADIVGKSPYIEPSSDCPASVTRRVNESSVIITIPPHGDNLEETSIGIPYTPHYSHLKE